MALKFQALTRKATSSLVIGQKITEHGITVERTGKGDLIYRVGIMVDGRRIHRTVGRESEGVTRQQAEQAIETFRTRSREDRLILPAGRKVALPFREGAMAYLERLTVEGGKGLPRKAQHINVRLAPFFSNHRLDGIDESGVREFVQSRKGSGAKPSTINRELATLSHMMRRAARWGWIARDKAPIIDRLREGPGRIVALSDDQCAALLDGAKADQDLDLWLFVSICLQTSMRHGEARRLWWEHYDAHRRRFYIPEAKAGERDQPVPKRLAEALTEVMTVRGVSKGYVFVGGPGSKTGYRHTFRKAFRRAVERAGLDPSKVTPHTMRHTAITKLVKAGVDLPTVQKVSGHKTLSMVLRYSHVDGAHIDNAIEHIGMG